MRITRTLRKHGTLQPAVASLLAGAPPEASHHLAHSLRPPAGIYNLSLKRVLRAFGRTLDQLDALAAAPVTEKGLQFEPTGLVAAQTELLEAMLAHIEDGYLILKACHPPMPALHENFADAWLEKARHPTVRAFKLTVKSYRDAIASLVNRVKHEHGQIRCVAFSDGSLQTAGYYLEGLDAQGVAMPDPSVHPGNTAFSFNRDLRYHFIQLFEIGSALKGALTSALRAQKLRAVESTYKSTSEEFTSIAERVSNLPQVVLPDEPAKPTPSVLARRDADDVVLSVTYPSLTKLVSPATIRFTTFISLDGGPLSYRVPYFAGDKNER